MSVTAAPRSPAAHAIMKVFGGTGVRDWSAFDDPLELLGFPTAARLWLSVAPGDLERVGAQLAALQQTTFVAAVSGPANLTASLVCRNESELYALLTDEVGAIEAVRAAEVSPVIRRIKQAGTVLHGSRLSL
jgi:DNA-binding Lrp family transcriptional regulator